ncbi:hypothetical protein ACS3YM_05775 [Nocardia sp. N13]|uniref:hypothetical protein n=1 Tax=Nocardioides sp. N13(2025) TaxID=3453405 RepID=UPI003F75E9A5
MARRARPGREASLLLGTVAVLLVALTLGAWGLNADRGEGAHGSDGRSGRDWVAVPGGWLNVSDVTTRSMDHRRVPGMATMPDADPVPAGMVRIRVGVVLAADRTELRWTADDFSLTGDAITSVAPHVTELGDGVVPAASEVSGGLVFDVPEEARGLALHFRGAAAVPVEVDLSSPGHNGSPTPSTPPGDDDHEHDDHEHDDQH